MIVGVIGGLLLDVRASKFTVYWILSVFFGGYHESVNSFRLEKETN